MDSEPLVPWREISALSLDRAEVLEAERDKLRAENEGLKSAYEIMRNVADSRNAQIERLRAALQQISGYPHVTAQIAIATLDACQT